MPHNERLHRANDHNVDQHDPTSRKNLEFFLGGFKKNGIKEEMSLKMYALKDVFRVGKKTLQELRMLSNVTLNCQVTKIVMNSGSQLSEL